MGSIIADIHDEEAVAKAIADESYDVVAQFIAYTAEDVERDIRLFRNKTKQYILSAVHPLTKNRWLITVSRKVPL